MQYQVQIDSTKSRVRIFLTCLINAALNIIVQNWKNRLVVSRVVQWLDGFEAPVFDEVRRAQH